MASYDSISADTENGHEDPPFSRHDGRKGCCRSKTAWLGVIGFLAVCTVIIVPIVVLMPPRGLVSGKNGMVATEEPRCSEIGKQILVDGGSAADAAIAAGLCIGVLNNFASGIGGGGFMLVRDAADRSTAFDFREEAPSAAFQDMYVGRLEYATNGGMASGVPGEIRGYKAVHGKYGVLDWEKLFTPAINLARNGFVVSSLLAQRLTSISTLVLNDDNWGESYRVNGRVAVEGDTIYRRRLADTLEELSTNPESFYTGAIAQSIIDALSNATYGTNMTLGDLANYDAKVMEPLYGFYRGMRVLTTPPPSSGAVLLFLLNVLEGYDLEHDGPSTLSHQRIVEAFKFGYAQRTYLGDPDYVANMTDTLARILSKEFAYQVRRNISDTQTFDPTYYGGEFEIEPTPGTTHIAIVDKNGNLASLTSTVNLSWGSKVMTRTGIIMNNQMDDFSTPGTENAYGLRASPANFIAPGKRPLSSSTPVAVFNEDTPVVVAGASGGSRIITGTLYSILNYLDFGRNILEAVEQPRIHHQLYPNAVELEYGFSSSIASKLKEIGHEISHLDEGVVLSVVQAVARDENGVLHGASDPRKNGLAAGF